MLNLLITPETDGYPTDYLLARIKGRRPYIFKDWDELILSPLPIEYLQKTRYGEFLGEYSKEGIWYHLGSEYRWLYRQMNRRLREDFYYVFVYLELKRIIQCLRYKIQKGGNREIHKLLSVSLISKDLKTLLIDKSDPLTIIEGLERAGLTGLKQAFTERGLSGLEEVVVDCFFKETSIVRLHPLIRSIFSYIIDSINITILYKYLRWSVKTTPIFIDSGGFSKETVLKLWADSPTAKRILNTKETHLIAKLMHRLTGIYIETITPSNIETAMKKGLTKKTETMRREGSDTGIILDYIWRRYIEAENLNIILHSEGLDSEAINKELIT